MSTKHFSDREFRCQCGKCSSPKPDLALSILLELVREWAGAPVAITSGYRCPVHNRKVGGARRSKHMTNQAADIRVKGKTPEEVYEFLDSIFPNSLGLAYNSEKNFTHIDTFGEKARRWTY
jgi:uncharacterized protein YcbK (DUF882 family)